MSANDPKATFRVFRNPMITVRFCGGLLRRRSHKTQVRYRLRCLGRTIWEISDFDWREMARNSHKPVVSPTLGGAHRCLGGTIWEIPAKNNERLGLERIRV